MIRRRRRRGRVWAGALAVALLVAAALLLRAALVLAYPYPDEYRDAIAQAGERYGIDPLFLAAVIRTESHFEPRAVSGRGARGLMQLLPATARELAGPSLEADDLFIPEVNVDLGARYLAQLRDAFGGALPAALAAYNGGGANVREWLASGRWDGTAAHADDIPFAETRAFVQRVYRAERMYRWLYERR